MAYRSVPFSGDEEEEDEDEFFVTSETIRDMEKETLIGRHGGHDSDDGDEAFQMELSEPHGGTSPERTAAGSSSASKRWAWFYVISASIMASLGGVLFGYDMGIISGAILQLRDVFCLSCLDQELVISAMLMGAVLGSLIGGFLIDHFGRRSTIIVNSVVFLVGALILGFAPNFGVLVVGRLLVGFAVSVSATGECIYISEIAPARRRGLLVSLNELGITLGLLLAYLCNFLFISNPKGWRWMFALSAVPAVVQGIGMFFLPMSPRFLMLKKREEDAVRVLKKLRGTNMVDREISGIRVSISSEKNQSCTDLCGSEEGMRGRMFIGIGLVFFQQITGQPNVLYYAPTVFEEIGFHSNAAATLATVGLGVVKVVMTVIALACVDRFGRRKLLNTGAVIMGISIFTLGVVCHFQQAAMHKKMCIDHSNCLSSADHNHSFIVATQVPLKNAQGSVLTKPVNIDTAHLTTALSGISKHKGNLTMTGGISSPPPFNVHNKTNISDTMVVNSSSIKSDLHTDVKHKNTTEGRSDESHASLLQKIFGFVSLMCYVAAYGFSFGPVTWLILSEIFPAAVKGRAIAMATVFNWGTNLIVTFTFLDIMNALGVTWTFTLFSIICAFSVMFIYSFVPETKNRTLEQVSAEMRSNLDKLQGPPTVRMKENFRKLCCFNSRHGLQNFGNYSRVQEETVT